MSADFSWRIDGLADLQKQLEQELPAVAKKVVRDSLNAGGDMMLESAHREAPRGPSGNPAAPPGFLGDHLDKNVSVRRDDLAGSVKVGAKAGVDYPDAEGLFKTKRTAKGKLRQVGRVSVARVARFLEFGTSKMSANPFLTRSFESIATRLTDLVVEKIKEGIEKVRG